MYSRISQCPKAGNEANKKEMRGERENEGNNITGVDFNENS